MAQGNGAEINVRGRWLEQVEFLSCIIPGALVRLTVVEKDGLT